MLEEFTQKHNIQPLLQKTIHFSCLSSQYGIWSINNHLNDLLVSFAELINDLNIKRSVIEDTSINQSISIIVSMGSVYKLLIEDLRNFMVCDINFYLIFKQTFAPNEKVNLNELESSIELLNNIMIIKRQMNEPTKTAKEILIPLLQVDERFEIKLK